MGAVGASCPAPMPGLMYYMAYPGPVRATSGRLVSLQSSFNYYFTLIEHWNGSSWSIVPSVNNGTYNHLRGVAAVSPGDVWAVGTDGTYPLIERWNGSNWSIFASPQPSGGGADFGVTAITSCDVWAVGRTYATNIGFQTLNERFTCQ